MNARSNRLVVVLIAAAAHAGCSCRKVEAQASPQSPAQVGALPSLAPLVKAARPAVVSVEVETLTREEGRPEDPFEHFFGIPGLPDEPFGEKPPREGTGSGFIIAPNGLVLTNYHVVENAASIRVTLADGRVMNAEVLGGDPLTDLALLELPEAKNLPTLRLGDSEAMEVGDWVVAIGSPFGLEASVSAGIVSARARQINVGPFDDFLQTDAAINPGNSGGPLLNLRGEVIGINTAIVTGATGIGFAIPSNMARLLVPQLERGRIRRGWLGVAVQDLTPELARALNAPVRKGAIVTEVMPGTPAARAGLAADDVISAVNGNPVESASALTRNIGFMQPGSRVSLTVHRKGERRQISVELAERPDLEGRSRPVVRERREPDVGLGLVIGDVDPRTARLLGIEPEGALIAEVRPGSPASQAGLEKGMVVVEAGGERVREARDLVRVLRKARPGATVLLRIRLREGMALRALTVPR